MRILVAPQEFKGTLTAAEVATYIALSAAAMPGVRSIDQLPLSDGGPGLTDAVLAARGGERKTARVRDPLMRPIDASWGLLPDGSGVIEMAAASGLVLVSERERDPLSASTYGTGELLRASLDQGCTTILLGIGGSATTDAGAGVMQALGARLLDERGRDLPPGGGALATLHSFDLAAVDTRLRDASIRIATDVRNTLCGADGAARMYAHQKGASGTEIETLDRALSHFADVAGAVHGLDLRAIEGGGAAGGLACGLLLIAPGATIEPGFECIAGIVGLRDRIVAADLVITGEGRLDAQTAYGKTMAGVARLARDAGKRVYAVVGSIEAGADLALFDGVEACVKDGPAPPDSATAARLLEGAVRRLLARALGEADHGARR